MISSWHQDADRANFAAPASLPDRADVVVVGGGVMGVAVCYWLARAGLQAVLLESRWLAWGASGRNAGLALAGTGPLEDAALMRHVLVEEGIDAAYAQPGHLTLASSAAIWERIRDEVARRPPELSPLYALEWADCEELLQLQIAPHFYGGRWLPAGGMLHPVRFVYGLAAAARRRGAQIATETAAYAISPLHGGGLMLATSRGVIQTRKVVCACNAATVDLLPELASCFQPVRGQLVATEPLPPLFRMGMAVDWGTVYWRQTENGTIVLGGYRNLDPQSETGRVEAVNPHIQSALSRFLPEAFPGFPRFQISRRWVGIMDETMDGRPLIGPSPVTPDCWVIAGFGGHGIPAALGAGKAVADALVDNALSPILQVFDPARFLAKQRVWG